ncbi:MAG: hypothetical protein JXN59_00185 [Anaerolineae bacterium]|nr:hypothetical protein [Anaerolineae bacterium]
MKLFDRLTLLVTGLIAIYLLWRFFTFYRDNGGRYNLYYMTAFGVLLVAGLLLIAFTYTALESPLVVIVAVLIPAGISAGLIAYFLPQFEKPYLIFIGVGLAAVAITRITGPAWLATVTLVIVHSVAGAIILGLPLWMVWQGNAPQAFVWVALGGLLIDLGGVALAFLKADSQLLFFSETVVFTILAPLLLLMTMSFAWGFSHLLTQA